MLPDIKFCPFCGHRTLFETEHVKCHGCGEEFNILTAEDLKDLQITAKDHQECLEPLEITKLTTLQEAVGEYLAEQLNLDGLEAAYDISVWRVK